MTTPVTIAQPTPQPATPAPPRTIRQRLRWWLIEIIAISAWLYAVLTLFVFDVDAYVLRLTAPSYAYLLPFKVLFIVGVLSILLLTVKRSRLVGYILFVLFYPIIVLLIKLPVFIFRQRSWVLAFVYANLVVSFFQSFKLNFTALSALVIALVLARTGTHHAVLWGSIIVVLTVLGVLYVRRFIVVFKPSLVFEAYLRFFPSMRAAAPQSFALDADLKAISSDKWSKPQMEKWTTNLQTAVLYNRGCLFVAKKLQDYQNSKLNFLGYVFGLILLTLVTVVAFAGVNLALFRMDHALFTYSNPPDTFAFFYYSFLNLLRGSSTEIAPAQPLSQAAFMLETFFEFMLGGLLVTLFFSVRNERHAGDLNKVVLGLEREGKSMEQFVSEEYIVPGGQGRSSYRRSRSTGLVLPLTTPGPSQAQ